MRATSEAPPEGTGDAEALDQADQDAHTEDTPRPCQLCCPLDGHRTDEIPWWLVESPETPAVWRFVHAIIRPLDDSVWVGLTRDDKILAARIFAAHYGTRALAQAIHKAAAVDYPTPHGLELDPLWVRLLDELHKRGAA